jgi:hypothetical protein
MNADGTNDHLLAPSYSPYGDNEPVWSPDGQRIFFTSSQKADGSSGYEGESLVSYDSADGFTSTKVTRTVLLSEVEITNPRVTPDGSTIYFNSRIHYGLNTHIARVSASGASSSVRVLSNFYIDYDPVPVGSGSTPPTSPPTTTTIPPTTTTTPATTTYVAMGDSYSAGEGLYDDPANVYYPTGGVGTANGPYDSGTDDPQLFNSCHRHKAAYGRLLAHDADLGPMNHTACSGAVTDDFYNTNHDSPNEPPQFSTLDQVGATTKVVTLTIGGNDAGFVRVLDRCTNGWRGNFKTFFINTGWGCSKDKEFTDTVHKHISYLGGAKQPSVIVGPKIHPISEVLADIHKKAPNATIYIAGYPQFFGTNFSYIGDAPSRNVCIVGLPLGTMMSIDSRDALWIDSQGAYLNRVIRDQVSVAAKKGIPVRYVSPGLFIGHGLCDESKPWLNSLIVVDPRDGDPGPDSASFHPTAEGQKLGYEEAFKRRMTQAR